MDIMRWLVVHNAPMLLALVGAVMVAFAGMGALPLQPRLGKVLLALMSLSTLASIFFWAGREATVGQPGAAGDYAAWSSYSKVLWFVLIAYIVTGTGMAIVSLGIPNQLFTSITLFATCAHFLAVVTTVGWLAAYKPAKPIEAGVDYVVWSPPLYWIGLAMTIASIFWMVRQFLKRD